MRKHALINNSVQGFTYWNLHVQCDFALLLGGYGVVACKRPTYREVGSHEWEHKRPLPAEFDHGVAVKVSCWSERYVGFSQSRRIDFETLTCVNGQWFNSRDAEGLGDFQCHSCVQVALTGYSALESKREQELYFFSRLELDMHSEVNMANLSIGQKEANEIDCLEPWKVDHEMRLLKETSGCPTNYRIEVHDARTALVRIAGTTDQCVALHKNPKNGTTVHSETCSAVKVAQLIPTAEISNLFTTLHQNTFSRDSVLKHGLKAKFFLSIAAATHVCTMTNVTSRVADKSEISAALNYPDELWGIVNKQRSFAAIWTGYLAIKIAGTYTFFVDVNRDEFALLTIDGSLAMNTCDKRNPKGSNSDWSDPPGSVYATVVLRAGDLPLEMRYQDVGGGQTSQLVLSYQGPDTRDQKVVIPSSALLHMSDPSTNSTSVFGCAKHSAMGSVSGGLFKARNSNTGVQCRFAPILFKRNPVEQKTNQVFKDGSWEKWWEELEATNIECQTGHVLSNIDVNDVGGKTHFY